MFRVPIFGWLGWAISHYMMPPSRPMLLCVAMVAAMCTIVNARSRVPQEWSPQNYPNPQIEPKKCGRMNTKASWVCDPNHIITSRHADVLDWFIKGTYENDTRCACSAYACEQNNAGYHISFALVRKIRRDANATNDNIGRLHDAKNFAYSLEQTLWDYGRCEDDIVVLYSYEDKILYTMAGRTAREKLTDELIQEISGRHGHHLQPDGNIGAGLIQILFDYRRVLRGAYLPPYQLQGEPILGGSSHVTSFVASFLVPFVAVFVSRL
ncbi:hypothetical protein ScPMuIL_012213 [Solemya velum]